MASEVEPPFVSAAENNLLLKTKGGSTPRPNSFLLIECNVGYAARLLRPRALGAPVAMTYHWEFGYTNKGIALGFQWRHRAQDGVPCQLGRIRRQLFKLQLGVLYLPGGYGVEHVAVFFRVEGLNGACHRGVGLNGEPAELRVGQLLIDDDDRQRGVFGSGGRR